MESSWSTGHLLPPPPRVSRASYRANCDCFSHRSSLWLLAKTANDYCKLAAVTQTEMKQDDAPLRGEVHKVCGELVRRELRRRLLHHLLQLLEGRPPGVVGEAQDGELNLRAGRARGGESAASLHCRAAATATTGSLPLPW